MERPLEDAIIESTSDELVLRSFLASISDPFTRLLVILKMYCGWNETELARRFEFGIGRSRIQQLIKQAIVQFKESSCADYHHQNRY